MAQNNLELMRTLDDSWNAQDWDTFEKRHSKDTTVFWPGQAEPTRGRDNHKAESIEFFKTFPDNHLINHPYKVEIAQGECLGGQCKTGHTGSLQNRPYEMARDVILFIPLSPDQASPFWFSNSSAHI